ncbi:MAG: hypothetical protein ACRDLP_00130 [Solirubrobacteraceae bacterium]
MATARTPSGASDYEDVTEDFWPLCNGWFVAATAGDDGWFHEHLAEEFVYLMGGGEQEPKDRTITMNTIVENRNYVLRDLTARRYNGVVLARGTYYARGDIPKGSAPLAQIERYRIGSDVRFSTVWVPRGGELRCVLFQSTTIVD